MKNNKLKYVLISFAVICLLLITGSICTYFLYILPQQEHVKLELQKQENEAREKERAEQAEQQRKDKFRDECIEEKKAAKKQFEDMINSCLTDLCVTNVFNNSSLQPSPDYIENCIDRKLEGLPTFGY